MGPWFAGDGIGETYLDPSYNDVKGNMVIDVTDFFSSLKLRVRSYGASQFSAIERGQSTRPSPQSSLSACDSPHQALSEMHSTRARKVFRNGS